MKTAQLLAETMKVDKARIAAAIKCDSWIVTHSEYVYIFEDGSQLVFNNQTGAMRYVDETE